MATIVFSYVENTVLRDRLNNNPTADVTFAVISGQATNALGVPEYSGAASVISGEFTVSDASITAGDKMVLVKGAAGPLGAYKLTATSTWFNEFWWPTDFWGEFWW
jgi:redox-sensitive bicupin YhaK (pirin superfamily)